MTWTVVIHNALLDDAKVSTRHTKIVIPAICFSHQSPDRILGDIGIIRSFLNHSLTIDFVLVPPTIDRKESLEI
jgi:hypothetical protein